MELPYAEDIGHYWKTSQSSPDSWVEKAAKLIEKDGGQVTSEAFGSSNGHAAFMLAFRYGDDEFKAVWPVLESKTNNPMAARRQAATLLFYDIKAKLITASVLGHRNAFFSYMMLPDHRTMSQLATPEIMQAVPMMLTDGK